MIDVSYWLQGWYREIYLASYWSLLSDYFTATLFIFYFPWKQLDWIIVNYMYIPYFLENNLTELYSFIFSSLCCLTSLSQTCSFKCSWKQFDWITLIQLLFSWKPNNLTELLCFVVVVVGFVFYSFCYYTNLSQTYSHLNVHKNNFSELYSFLSSWKQVDGIFLCVFSSLSQILTWLFFQ